jgi:hypothetical protein
VTSVLPHRAPAPAPPSPPAPRGPRLRSGLSSVVSTTVGGFFLSVLLLGGSAGLDASDPTVAPTVEAATARATPAEARLLRRYDCTSGSLPAHTAPGSALIREPGGRVHAVGFDRGWRIYRQHDARTLVAVCLRRVR